MHSDWPRSMFKWDYANTDVISRCFAFRVLITQAWICKKSIFLKASFSQNKNWLCVQNFGYNNLGLGRISLSKSLVFFAEKLFCKSNRKLFSCVCIAWYKHSRGWENSWQKCKPLTSSRFYIPVLNLSHFYLRLCKHRKRFLLLKWHLSFLSVYEDSSNQCMLDFCHIFQVLETWLSYIQPWRYSKVHNATSIEKDDDSRETASPIW